VHGYLPVRKNWIIFYTSDLYNLNSWMFDCCRVPNEGLDWSISYATPGDLGNSGHIIVLRKNRVWKVEVTQNGQLLSTKDIERQGFFLPCGRRIL
jgi:hypothetical protein